MKKRILSVILTLVIMTTLYSSGEPSIQAKTLDSHTNAVRTNSIQKVANLSTVKEKYPIAIAIGKEYIGDLNNDGTKETVVFSANFNGDEDEAGVSLTINGVDFSRRLKELNVWVEYPNTESYFITDINTSDNYKEIAILDEGPSSDPTTTYLKYDGSTIHYVGVTPDFPMNKTYKFSGNGTITVSGRLSILMTWFAPMKWKLNNNGALKIFKEKIYYPYDYTKNPAKTLKDLTIYQKQTSKSKKSIIKKGTKVTFIATDNKHWVKLKTSKGQQGWFYLCSGYQIEIKGKKFYDTEVFSNLCMYD